MDIKLLHDTEAFGLTHRLGGSEASIPLETKAILESCGCGSFSVPIPPAQDMPQSIASQIFNIAWNYPYGVDVVRSQFHVPSSFSQLDPYCCYGDIPQLEVGSICEQEVRLRVYATSVPSCLLNLKMSCDTSGLFQQLSDESLRSMNAIRAMQRFFSKLVINGDTRAGVIGLRNSIGIDTKIIPSYKALPPEDLLEQLHTAWVLARHEYDSFMFRPQSSEWVMLMSPTLAAYLRSQYIDAYTVFGLFTNGCNSVCAFNPEANTADIFYDTEFSLQGEEEIYLIRRNALTLVANLFDEEGNLSADGSIVGSCMGAQRDCFTSYKYFYFRIGGLLVHNAHDAIRIVLKEGA